MENNKTPPVCRYTPNIESIKRHIPIADLKGHQSINIKRIHLKEKPYKNFLFGKLFFRGITQSCPKRKPRG